MRAAFATLLTSMMLIPAIAVAQNTPPVADAGPDVDVEVGLTVSLQGNASDDDLDPITSWMWTVVSAPAGSTPELATPTSPATDFSADVAGEYVVSLVVSDGFDNSQPDQVAVTVFEILPPAAMATADLTTGPAPLTVNFDGSASTVDPRAGTLTFSWLFDDGTESFEMSPTHTFASPGTYHVNLWVSDSLGQLDFDIITIVVSPSANTPPTTSPSASPSSGSAPLDVQFAANASDADGDALTFSWSFGDGETSTDANPIHTYTAQGTYLVWLTVSDGQDDATASLTIVVDDPIDVLVQKARVGIKADLTGKVTLVADFTASVPEIDDEVLVTFDGIVLFSAPLSEFTLVRADEFNPGDGSGLVLKLKADDLRVKLDLSRGCIRVKAKYLDVSTLDNSNGVDVELRIGNGAGLENILMSEGSRGLRYRAE